MPRWVVPATIIFWFGALAALVVRAIWARLDDLVKEFTDDFGFDRDEDGRPLEAEVDVDRSRSRDGSRGDGDGSAQSEEREAAVAG